MTVYWTLVFTMLVVIAPQDKRVAHARREDVVQKRGHLTVIVYSATPCLAVVGANVLISRRWHKRTDEFGVAHFEGLPVDHHEVTVSSFGRGDIHGFVEVVEERPSSVVCDVASDEPCRDVSEQSSGRGASPDARQDRSAARDRSPRPCETPGGHGPFRCDREGINGPQGSSGDAELPRRALRHHQGVVSLCRGRLWQDGLRPGHGGKPRTGYNELIGGAVSRIAWARQSVTMALALANPSESAYLRTHLVPRFSIASLSLSATTEWYEPCRAQGCASLDLNPVTVLVHLGPRVNLGGVYALGLATGGAPITGPVRRSSRPCAWDAQSGAWYAVSHGRPPKSGVGSRRVSDEFSSDSCLLRSGASGGSRRSRRFRSWWYTGGTRDAVVALARVPRSGELLETRGVGW